ncbi:MAG: SpoIID/LytB domain-containing protein [bacterium]
MRNSLILAFVLLLLWPSGLNAVSAAPEIRVLLSSNPAESVISCEAAFELMFPQIQATLPFVAGETLILSASGRLTWVILAAGPLAALEPLVPANEVLWATLGPPSLGQFAGQMALAIGPFANMDSAVTAANQAQAVFPTIQIHSGYSISLITNRPYDLAWSGTSAGSALVLTSATPLSTTQKRYRGSLELFWKDNNGSLELRMVNRLDLESYLYGVVPSEMTHDWSLEALKAQSVAARSFAMSKMGRNQWVTEGFDVTATVSDQVYKGYDGEYPETNRAVDLTRGQVLTFGGNIAGTPFHSCSGGFTENNENVWSGPALPYLRGVPSPGEDGSKYITWTATVATTEFITKTEEKKGVILGELVRLHVVEQGVSGRIKTLAVEGSLGSTTLTGEQLRLVANLRSSLATIDNLISFPNQLILLSSQGTTPVSPESAILLLSSLGLAPLPASAVAVTSAGLMPLSLAIATTQSIGATISFSGHGWGHGVGMPQWGAKAQAQEGKTYDQILLYYYTGVSLETKY